MGTYFLRRALLVLPTLIGMSILIFALLRLLPGDVVDILAGTDAALSADQRQKLRDALGLGDPLPVQYLNWIGGVARGDFGKSLRSGEPIAKTMLQSLPITVELAVLALLMASVVAIPLGVLSAIRRNSGVDFWARFFGLIGLSVPNFWLATLILLGTSLVFQWVPSVTFIPPTQNLGANLQQMFLPAFVLSIQLMAIEMRMARTAMLEVLRHDYIRTARAKGLSERIVLYRHALRNAFIPVLTVLGIQLGSLLGGSVIVEQVFGLPGIGWFLVQGVFNRDYPVVQTTALFLAVVFVLLNLFVDVLYAVLDPRISFSR